MTDLSDDPLPDVPAGALRGTYTINPWMNPEGWAREQRALGAASRLEWQRLHATLSGLGAKVELVPPQAGLPDLVFTANAAVVLDGKALLARFRHPERQREEPHFETAFSRLKERGLVTAIEKLPEGIVLEGAGDCVWDETRGLFWMGYGPRSDAAARDYVRAEFGVHAVALELADNRFYHMDTALCPLSRSELMYYPDAFTSAGRHLIQDASYRSTVFRFRRRCPAPRCERGLPCRHHRAFRLQRTPPRPAEGARLLRGGHAARLFPAQRGQRLLPDAAA